MNYIIPVNNTSASNVLTLWGSTIAVEEAKPVPEPEIIGRFYNLTDAEHHVPVTAGCGGYSFHR